MHPVRQRKLILFVFMILILTAATLLVMYALRQNINLFYTPSQVIQSAIPANRLIRVGGMVVPGSIKRHSLDLSVQFKITDYDHVIDVTYQGILPDLFREGKGVVIQGRVGPQHQVQATQVLAKHDENYMPPEVKEALKKKPKDVS